MAVGSPITGYNFTVTDIYTYNDDNLVLRSDVKNMRSMSDITYKHEEDLEITIKFGLYCVEFHEGAHICGLLKKQDKPYYYFDCYFTTDELTDNKQHRHYLKDFEDGAYIAWNEIDNNIAVIDAEKTGYTANVTDLYFVRAVIEDNLALKSDLESYQLKTNTTITHYAPIEAGENIENFVIGKPVFMSGHVYKNDDGNDGSWKSATKEDTVDCICSVKSRGTWKEFVGVIVSVDIENFSLTFATHGDYLFYVDDSNIYAIGDVLLYDGRILDEDYALTLKIQQSIVGKVSAKINENTLALFKS